MSDEMKPIAWLGPIEDWGRFRTARTDHHCRPAVLLEDYQALQQQLAAAREELFAAEALLAHRFEQLQAAETDAARYRWLSENADIDDVFYDDKVTLTIPAPDIDGFNDLSEVIDATLQRDRQP